MLKKEQPFVIVDGKTGKKALTLKLVQEDSNAASSHFTITFSELLEHSSNSSSGSRGSASSHAHILIGDSEQHQSGFDFN